MSHRVTSPLKLPYQTSSAAETVLTEFDGILNMTGTGGRVVTLPDATKCAGLLLLIKDGANNALTNNITVEALPAQTPAQLIDGAATQVLAINGDSIALFSDGAGWKIWSALA